MSIESKTPRDEQGEYDFESLGALDVALFNEHLLRLLDGQEVTLPHYNFQTGRREVGETVQLQPDHIIIVEGIHGLNPDLVPDIPPECHLSHLCLGADAAQHRQAQPGADDRHAPDPSHRARRRLPGLLGPGRPSTAGRACAAAKSAGSFPTRNTPT